MLYNGKCKCWEKHAFRFEHRPVKCLLTSNSNGSIQIIESLYRTVRQMPLSVRRLVSALQASVEKSFPASKFIVSTGYLFLRVIVPCILQPDKFGMCHRALEDRDRRNLMLVGKVLQNLANASQFGDKEEHMRAMNPFLEKHQLLERLKAYMQILANQEDFGHASHVEPISVDEGHTIEDQMLLHQTLLTVSVCCFQIIDLLGIADQTS